MKKLSILIGSLVLGGVFIISSCSKDGANGANGATGATGATGPAGPVLTGTITGNVIMVNQYGGAVTNAYTNGYVKLMNPTTNATIDSVVPTSSGQYTINNVTTGTYNMQTVYAGYGLNVRENVEFTGGTLNVDNKIAAIPNFNVATAVDSVGAVKRDTSFVFISGTIAQDNSGERTILVFVGNTATTSSAPGNYIFVYAQAVPAGATTYSIAIPLGGNNGIYSYGFNYSGSIYFAVYGAANNYDYGDYTNFTYGQLTYTAISAASVIPTPSSLSLPIH